MHYIEIKQEDTKAVVNLELCMFFIKTYEVGLHKIKFIGVNEFSLSFDTEEIRDKVFEQLLNSISNREINANSQK